MILSAFTGGNHMGAAEWTGALLDWRLALEGLKERFGSVFSRSELRVTAGAFVEGLLSSVERKTGWMLAEQSGAMKPYRMQSLLGRSTWCADQLRDLAVDYVREALADDGGVLIIDETGFLKKGKHSVGVARQYSGTAGRIENSQIGVFGAYASRFGHGLVDRQLYLPKAWCEDGLRCAKAGVPDGQAFATKPAIAREMVSRLLDKGLPCAWVLADAVYGADSQFRTLLEGRQQPYVLAVRSNHTLRFLDAERQLFQTDPSIMAAELPSDAWATLTAGEGAKGPRLYYWARLSLSFEGPAGFERWVLVRKSLKDPNAMAYYFAFCKKGTSLAELAGAAGARWAIEECFLRAKDDLGLDHCEARSWHGWHRHMTLVMIAAAFLVKLSADQRRCAFPKHP